MATQLAAGYIELTVKPGKAMAEIKKDLLGLDKTAKKAGGDVGKALSTGIAKSTKASSSSKSFFTPFVRQAGSAGGDAGKALSRGFSSSVNISTGGVKSALSGVVGMAGNEGKQAGSKFGTNFLTSAKTKVSSGGEELLKGIGSGASSAMGNAGSLAGGSFLAGMAPKIASLGAKAGPVGIALAASAGLALAAGAVVGDQFMKGVARQAQRSEIKAKVGLDDKQAAAVFKQAENAYTNNFGASIKESVDTATALIQSGLAKAGDTGLSKMIGQVSTVAQVTGSSSEEIIKATNSMVKSGIVDNVEEAMDILTKGQQKGLNASGDMLDTFNEYSVQFKKIGLDGGDALGLVNQLMEGGARNSDLAADAIKEFSIRAVDGSEQTNKAFSDLGLDWQTVSANFAAGGDTAKQQFTVIAQAVSGVQDPLKKAQIQTALFGTQAEDLGDALNNIDPTTAANSLGQVTGAAKTASDELSSGPTAGFEKLGRQVEVAQGRFQDMLAKGLGPVAEKFADLIQKYLPTLIRVFGKVLNVGIDMAKGIMDFVGDIVIAVGQLIGGFGNLHGTVLRATAAIKRLLGDDEEADKLDAQADSAFGWGESIQEAGKKIKEQAKGLDKYKEQVSDTAEEMANATEISNELGESIEVMPDKKTIKVTDNSPATLKKLKDLGYTTKTLPDGTIEVVAETEEAQTKMDAWRSEQTGEPMPVTPTIDPAAAKKYREDLEKSMGNVVIPLGDPSLIPTVKPHGSGPDSSTGQQGAFASAGLMPNALRIGSQIHGFFPNMAIGGKRNDPYPDHPSGKAIDVMVGDTAGGHALGDKLFAKYIGDPGVNYILWKQTEFHPGQPPRPMKTRAGGNRTANHFDHLHIMTYKRGGGIPGFGGGDKVPALLEGGEHVLDKDDVKAMGGQRRVYAFRNALRFSTGGRVPDWDAIAMKESSGIWNRPDGDADSTGGLQIQTRTWLDYGGGAIAPEAYLASKADQIKIAEKILAKQGPGAWAGGANFVWKDSTGSSSSAAKGVTAEQRSGANAEAAQAQNDLDVALAERGEMAKEEALTTEAIAARDKRLAEKDAEIVSLKRAAGDAKAKADRYGAYPLSDEEDPVIAAEEDARQQHALLEQEEAKLADLKKAGAVQSEILKQQGVVEQQRIKAADADAATTTARADANTESDSGSNSDNPFVKITEGFAQLADLGVGGLKESFLPPGFSDPMQWPNTKSLGALLSFGGGLATAVENKAAKDEGREANPILGSVLQSVGAGISGGSFVSALGPVTDLIPKPGEAPLPDATHYGTGAPAGPGGEVAPNTGNGGNNIVFNNSEFGNKPEHGGQECGLPAEGQRLTPVRDPEVDLMPSPTPTTGPPTTNFFALDKRLQSLETKVVYVGVPDKNTLKRPWWDLHGPDGGKQGVGLAPQMLGMMHVPFVQLISEGPYQIGGTYERTDWGKREIKFQVNLGLGEPDTIFRYRNLESRWWASWSATEDGYLGVFTRTHGWRWLRVRLGEDPKTIMELDPQAFDNNFQAWDITALALQPYWCKRTEMAEWQNEGDGDGGIPQTPWDEIVEYMEDIAEGLIPGISKLLPGTHIGEANIVVPNRGSQTAWAKFLVSSPGICWIQDGPSGPMIELPLLTPKDGVILVDTDPTARTLTSMTDPVDPLFMKLARNSALIDFLLHDIVVSTLPVWRRFYGRFTTPWPARTVCRIKVQHSNAGGKVVALMPQQYAMAFGE